METTSSNLFAPAVETPLQRLMADLRGLLWVAKKEFLYFVRYPSWVIGLFVWPVIFPMGYILSARALSGPDGSGLLLFTQRTGVEDYLGYIAIGTTVWMWQNAVLWNVGYALRGEQFRGTLETNWMSPSWRFSFLLGPSLTFMVMMLIFLAISAVEFGVLFGVQMHGNPLLVLLVLLAATPSIYGLGMAFASLIITAKEANNFVFLVRGLVMIFCGITFPVDLLPDWMEGVAKVLPQTHILRAMRTSILTNASFQDLLPDLLILAGFGAFWLAAGYLIFNRMERRARQTGAIGQY